MGSDFGHRHPHSYFFQDYIELTEEEIKVMLIMSSRGSWLNQNFRHVLQILVPTTRKGRFESNYNRLLRNSVIMSGSRLGGGFWMHPGVNFSGSTNRSTSSDSNA